MSIEPPTVEYRDIPGHPGYRVGSDGSVWSAWEKVSLGGRRGTASLIGRMWRRKVGRLEKGKGYVTVGLKGRLFRVHTLVLLAFVGPKPEGMECCHGDGNKTNNNLSNLRWGTPVSNHADRVSHGTDNAGERNGRRRLTKADVQMIRATYTAGGVTQRDLADQYGVHKNTIYEVVSKKRWKKVGASTEA